MLEYNLLRHRSLTIRRRPLRPQLWGLMLQGCHIGHPSPAYQCSNRAQSLKTTAKRQLNEWERQDIDVQLVQSSRSMAGARDTGRTGK